MPQPRAHDNPPPRRPTSANAPRPRSFATLLAVAVILMLTGLVLILDQQIGARRSSQGTRRAADTEAIKLAATAQPIDAPVPANEVYKPQSEPIVPSETAGRQAGPASTSAPLLDVPDSYCLWPNDTLSEIALNANVTAEAILAANPGWTGQAGRSIQLPRGGVSPAQWTAPLPAIARVEDLPSGLSGYYVGRDNRRKRVALSFDVGFVDGNNERMEMLAQRGIRATFFVLGGAVENHPEMVADILSLGHELGNHSYSHDNMLTMSPDEVAWELAYTEQLVQAAYPGATTKPLFRAPFGAIDDTVLAVAHNEGYHVVGWTVDSRDWTDDITADQLYNRVISHVCPGAIIAFHDVNDANRPALPRLLDYLEGSGYQFVTVSEILAP